MNIALDLGSSSKPVALTYGPDMGLLLIADFYQAYVYGTLDVEPMPRDRFVEKIRAGELICSGVWDDDVLRLVWGNEVRNSINGRFLSFLFLMGALPMPVLHKMALQTWKIARLSGCVNLHGKTRVYIEGRKGWVRKLKKIGIRLDERGFVVEDENGWMPGIGGQ